MTEYRLQSFFEGGTPKMTFASRVILTVLRVVVFCKTNLRCRMLIQSEQDPDLLTAGHVCSREPK
jgi:hypothetical protein